MSEREWRTPNEVAAMLKLSPNTLANWRSQGKGPAYSKAGRLVRYWSDDVDDWMESH